MNYQKAPIWGFLYSEYADLKVVSNNQPLMGHFGKKKHAYGKVNHKTARFMGLLRELL